ncbi:methyltransferase family protein [Methanohalophilus euhalobius]|uniref:Methyltransferase domain-containing protein n=1 Tax=Methanohalophilus euhalobius TaxID=51203 RepID=A0A285GDV3_9EURY|nr:MULTISPECIES: class I SAM-dependent methyltransferase [Methanohalophilus]ODV48844.1 MAG: hypothetical protein A8273_1856 [Methanohalophilus sp. 2-GBenrich]TCL11593.1 methyltransferase family protein [Methanohalophilus euhalobius]SNY20666.1 Methyltransferase domain-containing protein [Methanohalophilus euhalobius]
MSQKLRICEIGPGDEKKMKDSIGIDIRKTKETNIIGDAHDMPFKNDCFDYVCSSHVIEHFSHCEVDNVLSEWTRILKPEGTLEILCPDLRARSLLFALKPSWGNIQNIYGGQDYSANYHKSGFSYKLLKNLLEKQGITQIKRIRDGYKGIPFIPNCLHVKGIKRNNYSYK